MTKNSACLTLYLRNCTSYDCDFFGTRVWNDYISSKFFLFFKILYLGFLGGKRAKNDLKLPVLVCFAQYLRNCWSYHQDFDNDLCRCFSFFFKKKKYNIVNIKIYLFFIGPLQQFFLIIICFSSSSINGKKKFWGVPHLLHMCVIFLTAIWLPHGQLWAILKGTASLTLIMSSCKSVFY